MNRPLNQFDRIAVLYDMMAGIFFLGAIKRSQKRFLHRIPDGANILILGGGTGWILSEVFRCGPASQVCYIDASSQMIQKARTFKGKGRVTYIHGTEEDIPPGQTFDVIITNFYLDLFGSRVLPRVIDAIMVRINPGGVWLVSEFSSNSWWQRLYLMMMYSFFQLTCGLQNSKLPEWSSMLKAGKLKQTDHEEFFAGFIHSSVYTLEN